MGVAPFVGQAAENECDMGEYELVAVNCWDKDAAEPGGKDVLEEELRTPLSFSEVSVGSIQDKRW
jgi:hypothetical protein